MEAETCGRCYGLVWRLSADGPELEMARSWALWKPPGQLAKTPRRQCQKEKPITSQPDRPRVDGRLQGADIGLHAGRDLVVKQQGRIDLDRSWVRFVRLFVAKERGGLVARDGGGGVVQI